MLPQAIDAILRHQRAVVVWRRLVALEFLQQFGGKRARGGLAVEGLKHPNFKGSPEKRIDRVGEANQGIARAVNPMMKTRYSVRRTAMTLSMGRV